MNVVFKNGCVISVMAIQNGRYANKVLRLDGEVTESTVKALRDFIFSDVSGTMNGQICDAKSFGKNDVPNKSAKLEKFDLTWGERGAEEGAEEEE